MGWGCGFESRLLHQFLGMDGAGGQAASPEKIPLATFFTSDTMRHDSRRIGEGVS